MFHKEIPGGHGQSNATVSGLLRPQGRVVGPRGLDFRRHPTSIPIFVTVHV